MIVGNINDGLHPRIVLEITGAKNSATLPMLVDTGFDVDVALHFDFADQLGLEIDDLALFEYANGQSQEDLISHVQVNWHGQWQEFEVVLSDDREPSIGTRLLKGCLLNMDFIHNIVTIDKPN